MMSGSVAMLSACLRAAGLRTGTYGYTMNIAAGANTTTGDLTIKGVMDNTGYATGIYVKNGAGSVRLAGANTFSSVVSSGSRW